MQAPGKLPGCLLSFKGRMGKATVIDTVEREGRTIRVYDNGMEYDMDNKKIVKPPAGGPIRTAERGRELAKKRHEKAARLLREAIVAETMESLEVPGHGPAASVAAAGGILWKEIVLNPDAYPRDRLEAWFKLGQMADIIPNANERQEQEKSDPATIGALADLVREVRLAVQEQRQADQLTRDVVDAESTDIRNDE
jgi:hypothetical protein